MFSLCSFPLIFWPFFSGCVRKEPHANNGPLSVIALCSGSTLLSKHEDRGAAVASSSEQRWRRRHRYFSFGKTTVGKVLNHRCTFEPISPVLFFLLLAPPRSCWPKLWLNPCVLMSWCWVMRLSGSPTVWYNKGEDLRLTQSTDKRQKEGVTVTRMWLINRMRCSIWKLQARFTLGRSTWMKCGAGW